MSLLRDMGSRRMSGAEVKRTLLPLAIVDEKTLKVNKLG